MSEAEDQILRLKDEVGDEWARAEHAIARIAELEAENERLRKTFTAERCAELMTALGKAEAKVTMYKWQRDECADELGRKLAVGYEYEATKPFAACDVIVDLNRRWDERGTQ